MIWKFSNVPRAIKLIATDCEDRRRTELAQGSCTVASFGFSGVDNPSGSATRCINALTSRNTICKIKL
jgi:hypothetical protein